MCHVSIIAGSHAAPPSHPDMGEPSQPPTRLLEPGYRSVSATLTQAKRVVGTRSAVAMLSPKISESRVAMAVHKRAAAQVTTDHEQLRKWVEARSGKPAAVKATHRGKDSGVIRVIFPGAPNADDDNLEEISWNDFFRKFEEARLAFLSRPNVEG
jgi:hypothetical protein